MSIVRKLRRPPLHRFLSFLFLVERKSKLLWDSASVMSRSLGRQSFFNPVLSQSSQSFVHFLHDDRNLLPVPYRGTPKYNTRRRLGSQIVRRRSLSQVSIGSARSECYQTPQTMRQAPVMPSPTPSRLSASQPSEYGTLRRYPMEAVQHHAAGFE